MDQARHNVLEVMTTGIICQRVGSLVLQVVHAGVLMSFGCDISRKPPIEESRPEYSAGDVSHMGDIPETSDGGYQRAVWHT
jgi:hypothetical protein